MRRWAIFLLFSFSFVLLSEPYKPYPILFVHGLGSNSMCWGAKCKKVYRPTYGDSIYSDSIVEWRENVLENPTYEHFLSLMQPYAIAWDAIDPSYTHPGGTPDHPNPDPGYPNKCFLKVVNMDDPWGSVDEDYHIGQAYGYESDEYTCWQDELYHRVKEVLQEYYGDSWESDSNAKIILIVHSTGAVASREMLVQHPDIRDHIYQLISVDGVNEGSWFATPIWKDPANFWYTRDWFFFCFSNLPLWRIVANWVNAGIGKIIKNYDLVWVGLDLKTWDDYIEFFAALEIMVLPWDLPSILTGEAIKWGYIPKLSDFCGRGV